MPTHLTTLALPALLLPLLLLTGCGGAAAIRTQPPPLADGLFRFTSTTQGFTLDYPEDWQVVSNLEAQLVVMPLDEDNEFLMSVNVVTENLPFARNLQSHWESAERILAASFEGYRTNGTAVVKVGGQEALRVDYQGTTEGLSIRCRAYTIMDGRKAYVITAACTPESFGRAGGVLTAVAETFHLIP